MFNKLRIQVKKGVEITTRNLQLNIDLRPEVAFLGVAFLLGAVFRLEVAFPEGVFRLEVEVHELE
ncbi:hypothetical protein [Clostridium kluyveri]|uniref:hypothetical protein n=1 Tax=Clostridium kluyveri TaxID=1534 RepID=UPI0012DF9BA0|nr:hypothetical protein [Clostridium kluyveri]